MKTRFTDRINARLERVLPERRVFLRTEKETRFIRLKPLHQALAVTGSALVTGWAIIAAAIILMDTIGAGNFREQAKREQIAYETRLNVLAAERDARAAEAQAAHARFNTALAQVSAMQSELLASEDRRRELETGINVVQQTLRTVMKDRDAARTEAGLLTAKLEERNGGPRSPESRSQDMEAAVQLLASALADTAQQRDQVVTDAQDALLYADEMELRLKLLKEQNDQIFRRLEEAMTVSVKPLDKMFRAAGLNTDSVLNQVRRGYSGQGGPLTPLSFSTKGLAPGDDEARANGILSDMDRLNLYRIAAEKAPFALPVQSSFRYTSGFGPRWGRMHKGTDFAAPHGTPIHSTADGVVVHAGWSSGYGKLIKIQHEFGIETRYAHLSKIRVKVGQRVSRGDRIGDMGNTGRSTGTHLHYEVRVGGKAVNPMTYIKAAKDVF